MGISFPLLFHNRHPHPLQYFSCPTEAKTKIQKINFCGIKQKRLKATKTKRHLNGHPSSSCRNKSNKQVSQSQSQSFVLSFITVVTLIFLLSFALLHSANSSSSSTTLLNEQETNTNTNATTTVPFTSTVRPWPSHHFLRAVISNSSDSVNLTNSSSESTLNNYTKTNTNETSTSLSQSPLIIPDHHHHQQDNHDPVSQQSTSTSSSPLPLELELPFPSSTKLPYSPQIPSNSSSHKNETQDEESLTKIAIPFPLTENSAEIQIQHQSQNETETAEETKRDENEDLQLERLFLSQRDESSENNGEIETETETEPETEEQRSDDDDPRFWAALNSPKTSNSNSNRPPNGNRRRQKSRTTVEATGELAFRVAGVKKGSSADKGGRDDILTPEFYARLTGFQNYDKEGELHSASQTRWRQQQQQQKLKLQNNHHRNLTRWHFNNSNSNSNSPGNFKFKQSLHPDHDYVSDDKLSWWTDDEEQLFVDSVPTKSPNFTQLSWPYSQSQSQSHSNSNSNWNSNQNSSPHLNPNNFYGSSNRIKKVNGKYSNSNSNSGSDSGSAVFLPTRVSSSSTRFPIITSSSILGFPPVTTSTTTTSTISPINGHGAIFPIIIASPSSNINLNQNPNQNPNSNPISYVNLNPNPTPNPISYLKNPSSSTPASAVFISISSTTPRPINIIANSNQISAFHWGSSGAKNPDSDSDADPNANPIQIPILEESGLIPVKLAFPPQYARPTSNSNPIFVPTARPLTTVSTIINLSTLSTTESSTPIPSFQISNLGSDTKNVQVKVTGDLGLNKVTSPTPTTPSKIKSTQPTTIWYKPVINHNYVSGSGNDEKLPVKSMSGIFPEISRFPDSPNPTRNPTQNPNSNSNSRPNSRPNPNSNSNVDPDQKPDPEPDVSPEMEMDLDMDADQNSEFSATYSNSNSNSNSKSTSPPSPSPPSYMDHLLNWPDQEDEQLQTWKPQPKIITTTKTTTTARTTRRPKVWHKVKSKPKPKPNNTNPIPKKRGRKRPTTTPVYADENYNYSDSGSGSDSTSDSESNSNSAGDENDNENYNNESSAEENYRVLFKLWDYSNGSLHLNNQREIPSWILKGYEDNLEEKNMVLNLRELPSDVQRTINDDILKVNPNPDSDPDEKNSRQAVIEDGDEEERQSDNLNGHWEQLPVFQPGTFHGQRQGQGQGQGSTAFAFKRRPGFSTNKRRLPINLNYVLWDSLKSGMPMSMTTSDDDDNNGNREKKPHDFLLQQNQDADSNQAHLQNYLHYLMRPDPAVQDATWSKVEKYIKKQQAHAPYSPIIDFDHLDNFPSSSFPGTKFEEQDISNVVAVSLILSHLKKLQGGKNPHLSMSMEQEQTSPNFALRPTYPQTQLAPGPGLSTPSTFTMSTPYRDSMDMDMDHPSGITPPQKDPTWDAIRPVLQHMIYNQNFSFLLPNPPSSTPITFTTLNPKYADDRINDFEFTSNSDGHSVFDSNSGPAPGLGMGYAGHQILQNSYPPPGSNPSMNKRRRPNRHKHKLNYHIGHMGLPKRSTRRPKIKRRKKAPSTTQSTYYDDAEYSDETQGEIQDEPPGSALLGETDESSDDYTKTLLTKLVAKKKLKKLKKKKKGYENFGFNFDVGMDIAEILKRKFIALLALKYAPLAVLLAAMLLPTLLMCFPWILEALKSKFKGRGRRRPRGKKKKYEYFDDDSYEHDEHGQGSGHDPYHPQIYPYRYAYPVHEYNDPHGSGSTTLATGAGTGAGLGHTGQTGQTGPGTGLGHINPSAPLKLGKPKGNIEIHHHFHGDQVTPSTFQPSLHGPFLHPIRPNQNMNSNQGQLLGQTGHTAMPEIVYGQPNVHSPTGYSISPAMYIESGGQFHDRESNAGAGHDPGQDNQYADSEFTANQYQEPLATTPMPSLFQYAQPSSDADNYMKRIRDIGRNLGKLIGSKISDQKNQEAMSLIFDSKKDAINQLLERWKLLQSSPFTPQLRDSDEELSRRRRDAPTFRKRTKQNVWSLFYWL